MKNLILLFILQLSIFINAQELKTALEKQLDSIKGITYHKIESDDLRFSEVYQVFVEQPLDHSDPNSKTFKQQVFLSHLSFDVPTLIETEGYSAFNHTKELSRLIGTNQIIVEHRYFGESKPDSLDWKYLTIKQAADDHHKIVEMFKSIYKGKWIASGISKGGQTSIYFRYFYPNDVDVTVPYVAPLNLEQEDARIPKFIAENGSNECQNKIFTFQKAVLNNQDSVLLLLKSLSEERGYEFDMGYEKALELNVLEYAFAFWQWGYSNCDEIPDANASAVKLFSHLSKVSSFSYFSNLGKENIAPFFYQAYTQIGYYGYNAKPLLPYFKVIDTGYVSSLFMAPKGVEYKFDGSYMHKINKWLKSDAERMLFIYGGADPWFATGVEVNENPKVLRMVKKTGSHRTRINSFEGEQKEKIYSTLEKWLGIKISR